MRPIKKTGDDDVFIEGILRNQGKDGHQHHEEKRKIDFRMESVFADIPENQSHGYTLLLYRFMPGQRVRLAGKGESG